MLPRLNPRHRVLTVICVSLTVLVALLYWSGLFLSAAELAARDWLTTNRVARLAPANPAIVFLALDEDTRSLDTVFADDLEKSPTLRLMKNGFPWSREVYAHVVERLTAAGAKAILFDLVFPAPREGDELFRAALERHSDRVVIGTNFVSNMEIGASVPSHDLPTPELRPPEGQPSWLGFVNVQPDGDDLVRRISYRTTTLEFGGIPPDGKQEEILSLAARGLEKAGFADRIPSGHRSIRFRYAEEIRPHSLHQIFVEEQWNAPPYHGGKFFRDKIVLIGATGQSSEDRVQTPFGVKIGPEIHLSAINAALEHDFLRETGRATNLALIVGAGLIAWMLGAWVRRPLLRIFLVALAVFIFWFVAQNLANITGLIPILLSPILALTTCGATWSAWEQILDRLERQRTKRALERYLGQDVAGEVLDPASYLNSLGGQRKPVTVLFSDIRGFTTLTESADAHELVAQLNEYFTEMVAIVFANHGTLDKFIGDAVMAHWGSIVTAGAGTDAARAVTAALAMREALARLNAGWKKRGMQEWAIGIGLNHGEPITGNIGAAGAHEKFEFTVVGDAVNLASRLEGTTKQYHLDLCIGETVASLVRGQFPLRSVDLIIVKGKTKPVEIFTVLGPHGATEPLWLPRHEEAVRLYRTGDFAGAAARWREVLEEAPGDKLTEVFLARCAELQKLPPTGDWTGVYEMQSK
jgi:adenylate cyclase